MQENYGARAAACGAGAVTAYAPKIKYPNIFYAALGISGGKLNEDMDSCYLTNLYTYNAKVSYSA